LITEARNRGLFCLRGCMTTIAWDGKTLAGDRRANAGGLPYSVTKVFRLSDGRLFAGSGTADCIEAVRDWLEGNEKQRPSFTKDEDFAILVISKENGKLVCDRYELKCFPMRIEEKFHAVGSGRDYAIAAMDFGKSAREAVEFASKYDIYTGNGIDVIEFDAK